MLSRPQEMPPTGDPRDHGRVQEKLRNVKVKVTKLKAKVVDCFTTITYLTAKLVW